MTRSPRIEYAEAVYHVLNRGNYRQDVFAVAGSGVSFEQTLFDACQRFGWRLHAYVLMSNHYPLCVETLYMGNLYGISKAIAQECRSRRETRLWRATETPISKARPLFHPPSLL